MTATPAGSARNPKPGLTADAKHDCGPRPAECTGSAATGRDVGDALAALSTEHRQVIIEIYYHNRSVSETADLLRISTAMVISRAYLGTRQLARALIDVRRPQDPPCRSPGARDQGVAAT
jgi:RNA polymerase sigma-70 factor (ECF subfamily)